MRWVSLQCVRKTFISITVGKECLWYLHCGLIKARIVELSALRTKTHQSQAHVRVCTCLSRAINKGPDGAAHIINS